MLRIFLMMVFLFFSGASSLSADEWDYRNDHLVSIFKHLSQEIQPYYLRGNWTLKEAFAKETCGQYCAMVIKSYFTQAQREHLLKSIESTIDYYQLILKNGVHQDRIESHLQALKRLKSDIESKLVNDDPQTPHQKIKITMNAIEQYLFQDKAFTLELVYKDYKFQKFLYTVFPRFSFDLQQLETTAICKRLKEINKNNANSLTYFLSLNIEKGEVIEARQSCGLY